MHMICSNGQALQGRAGGSPKCEMLISGDLIGRPYMIVILFVIFAVRVGG